jgi:ketosteroid isomerase-like protein
MSQENVEVAKQATDALNRRDWDAFYGLISDDFEWLPAMPGAVQNIGYQGRGEFAAYVREVEETWEYLLAVMEEFRDLGDRVLLIGRMEGCGRASGAPVNTPVAEIMDFRDGKLSRDRVFLDHAEALRAADLSIKE